MYSDLLSSYFKVIQFCYVWRLYLKWNRLIELFAYIISMVYIVNDFQRDEKSFKIGNGERLVNSEFSHTP